MNSKIENFIPLQEGKVTLYTCGPTVYDTLTVGNWLAYLRWDLLVRVLTLQNFYVERVMNITDVGHLVSDSDEGDDKMQKGASREGITAWEVAERYTDSFITGMNDLNLIIPQHLTKATKHIASQIALIETLEQKGHTYRISDGIYFDTSTFPKYAAFAKLDLKSLKAGARTSYNTEKRNTSDFALWKFSPIGEKRDMEWESPWGKGFPGWHIECSAMAMQYLGSTLDIHTGGIDHIPVHHTNEIAQSESASGHIFSQYWLHANFLMVNGGKISKSLGNGYTLADIEKYKFTPDDFRVFALQSHYRTESNFTWQNIAAASSRLKRWKDVAVMRWQIPDSAVNETHTASDHDTSVMKYIKSAEDAVKNDLNSPLSITLVEKALDYIQENIDSIEQRTIEKVLGFIDQVFGIPIYSLTPDIEEPIKILLHKRASAREKSDWKQSDELRQQLVSVGVAVNDSGNKQYWTFV